MALPFPDIDPVAIAVGPVVVRWYALAYLGGLLLGWLVLRRLARNPSYVLKPAQVDDLLFWVTLGIILGGRLGYIIFYNFHQYLLEPWRVFALWQGGMSFHGGAIGVIVALALFAKRYKVSFLRVSDAIALLMPIGLFFGRIANFINGELYGRVAPDAEWAMVFPRGGDLPRHPSQLYEAALEGLALFVILMVLSRLPFFRQKPGSLASVFLIGYGLARFIVEFYREPDPQLGFLFAGATMGQVLSVPMIVAGIALLFLLPKERKAA